MMCTTPAPSDVIEEGDFGGGIILQTMGTTDPQAESAVIAVPETGKGTAAGPGGGTLMATAGVSRPRVLTPQAAGDGSIAGLGTRLLKLLMVGTELQGVNRMMSQWAWGGVSAVSGHNGILPGNPWQQPDDLIDSGRHLTPLSNTGKGSTPYQEGYYCMSCY